MLQRNNERIKKEEFVSELQFEKLKGDVQDLENRLKNFQPSNIRANIANAVAIISALLSAAALIIKLKLSNRATAF